MANEEEKKDDLFNMNVGDGLIEIDDVKQQEATQKTDGNDAEQGNKIKDETEIEIYDDGSFEIDEFAAKKEVVEDDKEKEFIENTKEDKEKAPSESKKLSDSSPSSSPYLAFAKDRASEGVFLDFNEDDWKQLVEENENDEAAALRQLSQISMMQMVKQGVESYKESLTPEEKALYEAKEKGIPVDAYGIAKSNLKKYSTISKEDLSENESLQEELVSKVLEMRNFSPEEIQEEIEGYKALENLESKAEKALSSLPKVYEKQINDLETQAAADEQSRKDSIRQRVAKMKQLVETTPEIIPGIKLNKPTQEKIMKSMTTPIAKDDQGNPLNPVMATRAKNPDAFEMMLHYYHELGLFNIDDSGAVKPDFSKISKVEKTKAADEMRTIFESTEKFAPGKAKQVKTQDDELDLFDKAFSAL